MEISLSKEDLFSYLKYQTEHLFPDKYKFEGQDIILAIDLALDRLEYCYKFINNSAYFKQGQTFFNHLHGDQFSQFLYYLMNSLWKISENRPICDKLIQLNRMLSGSYFTYNCGLPDIFYWSHPIGTVLGKADYGNFFYCTHNCTVATQKENGKSRGGGLGIGLFLGAGASIYTDNIKIGDRVAIGAGTSIYREDEIESDTLVINRSGENEYLKRSRNEYNRHIKIFNIEI